MRNLLFITVAVVVVSFAVGCKSNPTVEAASTENTDFLNKPNHVGDTLFLSIERTPCFGKCPIYKLQVFQSGLVLYEAVKFNDQTGTFQTRITKEKMLEIATEAKRIGYFELKDEYDGPVTDLPATITAVNAWGKSKKIRNRWQGPAELKAFEKYLDEQLKQADWKPYNMPLPEEKRSDY